jgi:UDP:flavonoid glycosyltransferase YjiC (YdhE family)
MEFPHSGAGRNGSREVATPISPRPRSNVPDPSTGAPGDSGPSARPASSEELRRRSCLRHLGIHEDETKGIFFKLASGRDERDQAFRVLHDAYVKRGLCDPSPSGRRTSVYSFLPTTAIAVAMRDRLVLSTMSLIEDSKFGLPLEELYPAEVDDLRARGRRVSEIGALAVRSGERGHGLTLWMNSLLLRWGLFYRRLDDLLIAVHPRSAPQYQRLYLFEPLGEERPYGKLRNAPAVLLRLDLRSLIPRLRGTYDLTARRGGDRILNFYRFLLIDPNPSLLLPAATASTGVTQPPAWDPLDIADMLELDISTATSVEAPRSRIVVPGADFVPQPSRSTNPDGTPRIEIFEREGLVAPFTPPAASEAAPTAGRRKRKVLFVGEAMTLSNVAKPLALASGLDPEAYDVVFAADPRYASLYRDLPFPVRPIRSISSERYFQALAGGSPIHDADTLRDYVREDLETIGEVAPDAVVGCMRLSLAISARLANVPYLAVTQACFSPYRANPLPFVNPMLHLASPRGILAAVKPVALAYYAMPFNQVSREFGVRPVGADARRVFTEADHTLYGDIPELFPMEGLPPTHHYLGMIDWSPAIDLPPWWNAIPGDKPQIYVTMGSSGRADILPAVLDALADLPVSVLVSTAGRVQLRREPANAFVADFLPGRRAAAQARVVVCNGGPTAQQAVSLGVPAVGIAGNMHQTWNMEAIERAGAGVLLRAASFDPGELRARVVAMLSDAAYSDGAIALAVAASRHDPVRRLERVLSLLPSRSSAVA